MWWIAPCRKTLVAGLMQRYSQWGSGDVHLRFAANLGPWNIEQSETAQFFQNNRVTCQAVRFVRWFVLKWAIYTPNIIQNHPYFIIFQDFKGEHSDYNHEIWGIHIPTAARRWSPIARRGGGKCQGAQWSEIGESNLGTKFCLPGLVNVYIAMENGHRNSGFSH